MSSSSNCIHLLFYLILYFFNLFICCVGYQFTIINSTSEIAHVVNVCPNYGWISPQFPNIISGLGGTGTGMVHSD